MTLNVLGTEYAVSKRRYHEDSSFAESSITGYCDGHTKEIVFCDMSTNPGWQRAPEKSWAEEEKKILRHEIVHAYLNESGLDVCALEVSGGWAKNEEMVDWFAIQGPKIVKTWTEAGAI